MDKKLFNQKGLTLVEILAAIVILTIVLLSFSSFFIQSAKNTQYNKEKLTSVEVAEEVVAEVRNGYFIASEKQTRNGYEVEIIITDGPDSSLPNLKKAEIKVKPDNTTGTKKSPFTTEMYFEESP